MNLNNFVVLPNKTAQSFKLNARNQKALRMEAVTLAHEGMVMEKRLQQLKESMSKEKQERRRVGLFGWKSGQSSVPKNGTLMKDTNKENKLQKLSAGKVKIRVLKDEKHTDPPEAPAPTPPPPSLRPTQKVRTTVKTAPKVSVLTLTGKNKGEINQGRNSKDEMTGPSGSLLRGEYSEEESARSFQEAIREWRGERRSEAGDHQTEEAKNIADHSASVSAMATQSDLPSDKASGGRGKDGGQWKTPFRVEFTQSNLSYMDRLCLKKHRRTPIELPRNTLTAASDAKSYLDTSTEEASTTLTAQVDDVQHRRASLCEVPAGRSPSAAPELNIVIKVPNEVRGMETQKLYTCGNL